MTLFNSLFQEFCNSINPSPACNVGISVVFSVLCEITPEIGIYLSKINETSEITLNDCFYIQNVFLNITDVFYFFSTNNTDVIKNFLNILLY